MTSTPNPVRRTAGQAIVDVLRVNGIDHAFCVPGESFLRVIDALYDVRDSMKLVVCRHEAAAANMAEAYARLTGKVGVCFVTRGPGATHASIGVHTAFQSATPLLMFVGQVERGDMGRGAFQEIDYRQMFGPMTKWVAQIDDARRVPEMVARAMQLALSGRPGPVVLALPEDMLADSLDVPALAAAVPPRPVPSPADMERFAALLAAAARPVVIVGGGGWDEAARTDLRAFVEGHTVPVAAAFRRQDSFDNRHACYVGHLGLAQDAALAALVRDADLVVALGTQLGDITTASYTLLDVPRPRQPLVHVHPGVDELGSVYQADLMIGVAPAEFAAALSRLPAPADLGSRRQRLEAARAAYLASIVPPAGSGPLDFGRIIAEARDRLPPDTIIANGAGNYTSWIHKFYQYGVPGTQLAPTNGAMAYGVPAAIAAAMVRPGRLVLSFAGDGCFLMNCQELATAVHYAVPVIFIVVNNGSYGTIRMYQERGQPGRTYATDLTNPDFAAFARSFGMLGETVRRTEEFWPAFERARASGRPALLELQLDIENISAGSTLTALRAAVQGEAVAT